MRRQLGRAGISPLARLRVKPEKALQKNRLGDFPSLPISRYVTRRKSPTWEQKNGNK